MDWQDTEKFIANEHEMEKAISVVDRGEAKMACLLRPIRVEQVTEIALGGGILPQKFADFLPEAFERENDFQN